MLTSQDSEVTSLVKLKGNAMNRVWKEMVYAARQAPRMYFAPLVGAIREVLLVTRQIRRGNQLRATNRRGKLDK